LQIENCFYSSFWVHRQKFTEKIALVIGAKRPNRMGKFAYFVGYFFPFDKDKRKNYPYDKVYFSKKI
jgi:hypothetical protein